MLAAARKIRRARVHSPGIVARSATAVASADVGGSRRVWVGRRYPSFKKRIVRRKGSAFLNGRYGGCVREHRQNLRRADRCTGHRLHAVVAVTAGTTLTVVVCRRDHVGWHRHLCRHSARLKNGHARPNGDNDRKEQSKKLSNRPAFHGNRKYDAKMRV
jgi:hypothetical protein